MKLLTSSEGLPLRSFSEGALTKLQTMSWPGTVLGRLRNAGRASFNVGPYVDGEIRFYQNYQILNKLIKIILEIVFSSDDFTNLSLRDAREVFERDYLMAQINRFGSGIYLKPLFLLERKDLLYIEK